MTTVGPTAQRLARDAASVPAPPAPREPIHSETMRALVAAWFANCGREPEPSEVAEGREVELRELRERLGARPERVERGGLHDPRLELHLFIPGTSRHHWANDAESFTAPPAWVSTAPAVTPVRVPR